jgi:hypothetical protein
VASTPVEASHIKRFTPASLAEIEGAPVFLLKAGSRRDRLRHEEIMAEEHLNHYDQESIRAETLRGLEALWSPDDYEIWAPRLQMFWEARDQWVEENRDLEEKAPFEFTDFDPAEVRSLSSRVSENWPPLRKMAIANLKFDREFPKQIGSIILVGWSGIEAKFERADGLVSLDAIDLLERDLAKIEFERLGTKSGAIFAELMLECANRLFLSASAEKNSASQPPSSTAPPISNNGQELQAGTSKASEISPETPAS